VSGISHVALLNRCLLTCAGFSRYPLLFTGDENFYHASCTASYRFARRCGAALQPLDRHADGEDARRSRRDGRSSLRQPTRSASLSIHPFPPPLISLSLLTPPRSPHLDFPLPNPRLPAQLAPRARHAPILRSPTDRIRAHRRPHPSRYRVSPSPHLHPTPPGEAGCAGLGRY